MNGRVYEPTLGRTAVSAVIGGVSAELGGGKFLNGALTGAFQRLYNDEELLYSERELDVDDEGTPVSFPLIVDGDRDLTLNTVVSDGNGGMRVQLSIDLSNPFEFYDPTVVEGLIHHENQHIDDFYKFGVNLDILKRLPDGVIIKMPLRVQNVIERRAYRVELNFLRSKLPGTPPWAEGGIRSRIGTLEQSYLPKYQ